MYTIEVLPLAKLDLDNITFYITNKLKSPAAAKKILLSFYDCIKNIAMFPYGESIIYLDRQLKYEYRIAKINNYLIIYTINNINHLIYIVRIIYNKMDYYNILE